MQNPYELILNKLEQIERTIIIWVNTPKPERPESADPNRMLNLPEAAKLLRKPVGTVRGYIHTRNLPATLVGKSYLIKYKELLDWFQSMQVKKEDSPPGTASVKMIEGRRRYRKTQL
jgi:excisionase family DNA binding protein